MNKKFSLFLVVCFLSVQVFSLFHMAEHGFKEHKHNGHVCGIYLYGEQAKSTDLSAAPVLSGPSYIFFEFSVQKEPDVHSIDSITASERAPPTLS